MRAMVWHGKEDIRCDRVTDSEIEHPRDAIIKVTSCAICGSDLHLFHNLIPATMPGDIMGHEMMGEVVEVGTGVDGRLKKGDRIVVPFTAGPCIRAYHVRI
jgi:threonine dehydrogenase-like Zn-dependent dehydrogenase